MSKKVVIVCANQNSCCQVVCYTQQQLNNLNLIDVTIESQLPDGAEAIKFGITQFPTILFLKNDRIACKKTGKFSIGVLKKELQRLEWM